MMQTGIDHRSIIGCSLVRSYEYLKFIQLSEEFLRNFHWISTRGSPGLHWKFILRFLQEFFQILFFQKFSQNYSRASWIFNQVSRRRFHGISARIHTVFGGVPSITSRAPWRILPDFVWKFLRECILEFHLEILPGIHWSFSRDGCESSSVFYFQNCTELQQVCSVFFFSSCFQWLPY